MSVSQLLKLFRRQRRNYFVVLLFSLLSTIAVIQTVVNNDQCTSIWNICVPVLPPEFNESTTDNPYKNYDELNVSDDDSEPSTKWLKTLETVCASQSNSHAVGFSASCSYPILTMFTAMEITNKNRTQIHNNTIINWSSLGNCVQQILFLDRNDSSIAQLAARHGWIVEMVPRKLHDIPVIRSLFLTAFKLSSTPLYLYSNADILFDNGLIKTTLSLLCALKREANETGDNDDLQQSIFDKGIFAVGKRTNVPLTKLKSVLPDALPVFRKTIHAFRVYALDYFITTSGPLIRFQNSKALTPSAVNNVNGHFPWEKVPDLVIGRPGYDNWLAAQALRWNVTLAMDFSRTVLAVHQTGVDGIRSGFTVSRNTKTQLVNFKFTGKNYAFEQGETSCLPWFSFVTQKGDTEFLVRQHRKEVCSNPNYKAPRFMMRAPRPMKQASMPIKPASRHMMQVNRHIANSKVQPSNLANRRYSLILAKKAQNLAAIRPT